MGRQPCCAKVGLKKGPWSPDEDKKLLGFLLNNPLCCWRLVPKLAGSRFSRCILIYMHFLSQLLIDYFLCCFGRN
jgi:hypothetical protein